MEKKVDGMLTIRSTPKGHLLVNCLRTKINIMKNFQVALSTAFTCTVTNCTPHLPLVANIKLIPISKYNFLSVITFSVMQE